MPGKHTAKQKRQARHVYDSERRGGASAEDAKRIAWATVNKRRNPAVNPELEADIIQGMARLLWVSAYADFVENQEADDERDFPSAGPGQDWDDVAPETPAAANRAARDLAGLFAANEGFQADDVMVHLFELAAHVDIGQPIDMDPAAPYDQPRAAELQREFDTLIASGKKDSRAVRRREAIIGELDNIGTVADMAMGFGSDLAAQALGSGVSWEDDHTTKRPAMVFAPKFPRFECSFDGEDLSWSGSADGGSRASGHEHTRSPRVTWEVIDVYIATETDSGEDEEAEEQIGHGNESMWPTDAERELGVTPVDKAVAFLHAKAEAHNGGDHELEPNYHGSPHSLSQGPERNLVWTVNGDEPIHGASSTRVLYRLEGFTWAEQREVFERIYRDEWAPRPTQIGGITVVNPDDIDMYNHRYVLWFDAHAPRYLMAYANGADSALDACVDWLEDEGLEGYFVDDQVREAFEEARAGGASENSAWEFAEADTTVAGNHGRHLNSEDWGISAEDPNDDRLRALGREAAR